MWIDWIYPPRCMACRALIPMSERRARDDRLCYSCGELFEPISPPTCLRCGLPSEAGDASGCASCRSHSLHFSQNRSCFVYEGLVRDIIHNVKFRGDKRAAEGLGRLWAANADTDYFEGVDLLATVPLHKKKRRERGFNQVDVMAEPLCEISGVALSTDLLERRIETPPLVTLTPRGRAEALSGAFAVSSEARLEGKNIVLLDDIYTTGQTLSECARILIGAGASRVACRTFAITPPARL
ncbi:MAG: ComF family protein [Defluviitaleaceae bacterium]|nr:ComF family protein [Defluviitaleaceae bacterium]